MYLKSVKFLSNALTFCYLFYQTKKHLLSLFINVSKVQISICIKAFPGRILPKDSRTHGKNSPTRLTKEHWLPPFCADRRFDSWCRGYAGAAAQWFRLRYGISAERKSCNRESSNTSLRFCAWFGAIPQTIPRVSAFYGCVQYSVRVLQCRFLQNPRRQDRLIPKSLQCCCHTRSGTFCGLFAPKAQGSRQHHGNSWARSKYRDIAVNTLYNIYKYIARYCYTIMLRLHFIPPFITQTVPCLYFRKASLFWNLEFWFKS